MQVEAGYLARLASQWYGDRVTFVEFGRGLSRTFRELNRQANRLGSGLRTLGIPRWSRVGVCAHNSMEVVETWLGLEKHGLVRVALHSHLPMPVLCACMNEVGAVGLVFSQEFAAGVARHLKDMPGVKHFVYIGDRRKTPGFATHYDDIVSAGSEAEPRVQVDEDTPCTIQYTSGTTGAQ